MSALVVFGVTAVVFLCVVAGMAVGVMMGRREISGSCGGLGSANSGPGEPSSCSLCSNPAAACEELRKRMQSGAESGESCATGSNGECAESDCTKEAIDACNDH